MQGGVQLNRQMRQGIKAICALLEDCISTLDKLPDSRALPEQQL